MAGRAPEDERTALADLIALHDRVDQRTAVLATGHAARLKCRRGCAGCCVDGLTVFAVEAERIRVAQRSLLRDQAPHPAGACAFLDSEGACRIYADRPYVCRSQGLPLRWHEEGPGGGTVERRDICPENEAGTPSLLGLSDAECWTIGPIESELAAIAQEFAGACARVALRDLFDRT